MHVGYYDRAMVTPTVALTGGRLRPASPGPGRGPGAGAGPVPTTPAIAGHAGNDFGTLSHGLLHRLVLAYHESRSHTLHGEVYWGRDQRDRLK